MELSFYLEATNLDGEINTGGKAQVFCHIKRQIENKDEFWKQDMWLERCDDLDFYVSWGYVEEGDAAVMTIL